MTVRLKESKLEKYFQFFPYRGDWYLSSIPGRSLSASIGAFASNTCSRT